MNLLAIETATDVCSVALLQQGRPTVELLLARPRAHAENLVSLIRDALRYGALAPAALDAVAVSMGPGSYTGLRIGVSTAKGLAVAVDAALVGIPSLAALAASVVPLSGTGAFICTAFDARRDEVYAAGFEVQGEDRLTPAFDDDALSAAALAARLTDAAAGASQLWLAGDGAPKVAEALGEASFPVTVLDPAVHPPSAAWVGRLALERLARGETADVAAFEPFYLKAFVAKKRKGSAFEKLPF